MPAPGSLNILPDMPRNKAVGIGCVGAGFIMADCQLVAYQQAGFQPLAITSRTREHAERVAQRHGLQACDTVERMLEDPRIEVVDIAVPPDVQFSIIEKVIRHGKHVRGILAQKPLGVDYAQARELVRMCRRAKIVLAVNQNMRFDHSVRGCHDLLQQGMLGDPVLATIDMRAIPHWMPWQKRQGWVTLRILSIHHLDTFRYWFGDPLRVYASVRPDPRTQASFRHRDGICIYILEYANGLRATSCDDVWAGPNSDGALPDHEIRWRVEGLDGMAQGTIGWPKYPDRCPSELKYTSKHTPGAWIQPAWDHVWFPDAFAGPMADLLCGLESGTPPSLNGQDNLKTMALVDACYLSAREHRAVKLSEITRSARSAERI